MIISDPKEKKAILDRMESNTIDAHHKTSRIKACIYGDKGCGKSVASIVLAKKLIKPGQSIIFVDTSEGWLSLRNHKDWGLLDDVKIIPFDGVEQLSVLAEAVFRRHGQYADVGAIVLDDADFMAAKTLNDIWGKRVAGGKSSLDPDKPERPDYLKLLSQFGEIVEDIYTKTPDVHLIMTAHAAEKKSKEGDVVLKVFPGFNPALSNELAGKQQIVTYLLAKEVKTTDGTAKYERTFQVHPSMKIEAKTRVGFDRIRIPYVEFINTVVEWSIDGKAPEDEKAALLRDIETSQTKTDLDSIIAAGDDDDAPVFVG